MLERILEITELYIDLLQKDYPKALTDNLWQAIINLRWNKGLDVDEDGNHETMKIMAERYHFAYRRVAKNA